MGMDDPDGEWLNSAEAQVPSDFPDVFLWRMLIAPRRPKRVSKGGIILPGNAQDAEDFLTYVGQVVAMGSLCYRSDVFKDTDNIPKVGDWVVYGRYAGQRIVYRGFKFIFLNDKEVLGRVADPDMVKIHTD